MAFDFPSGPTLNQEYAAGPVTYKWNGVAWDIKQGSAGVTPAALTKTDDTNVTVTLGGAPATALLQATSMTMGWSGSLAATRGGTGQTTYAVGDLLYGGTSNTLQKLASVAVGNALITQGVGASPIWGKVGLTTHISGTLPVGNGGTGQTTAAAALTALGGVPLTGNSTITGDVLFKYPSAPTTDGYIYFGTLSQWIGFAGPEFFISHKMTIDAANPTISLRKATNGQGNYIYGCTGALATGIRWRIDVGNANSETGSNAGSDFIINRHSDTGVYLGQGLTINRASGDIGIAGNTYFPNSYIAATGVVATTSSYSLTSTAYYFGTGGIVAAQGYKPGGGVWADSSDLRIKNVEGEYTRGLAEVIALRPVYFTFKGNDTADAPEEGQSVPYPMSAHATAASDGKKFAGMIAQEVEAIFPEMVTKRSAYIDGVAVDDLRDLDTTPLIFALINAVKELKAEVEALKAAR